MVYKAFPLTKKESKNPMFCGYKYAYENKNRWVELTMDEPDKQLGTYDVSKTSVVLDGIVYTIYKDFIIIDEDIRLFILQARDLENDRITEEEETKSVLRVKGY